MFPGPDPYGRGGAFGAQNPFGGFGGFGRDPFSVMDDVFNSVFGAFGAPFRPPGRPQQHPPRPATPAPGPPTLPSILDVSDSTGDMMDTGHASLPRTLMNPYAVEEPDDRPDHGARAAGTSAHNQSAGPVPIKIHVRGKANPPSTVTATPSTATATNNHWTPFPHLPYTVEEVEDHLPTLNQRSSSTHGRHLGHTYQTMQADVTDDYSAHEPHLYAPMGEEHFTTDTPPAVSPGASAGDGPSSTRGRLRIKLPHPRQAAEAVAGAVRQASPKPSANIFCASAGAPASNQPTSFYGMAPTYLAPGTAQPFHGQPGMPTIFSYPSSSNQQPAYATGVAHPAFATGMAAPAHGTVPDPRTAAATMQQGASMAGGGTVVLPTLQEDEEPAPPPPRRRRRLDASGRNARTDIGGIGAEDSTRTGGIARGQSSSHTAGQRGHLTRRQQKRRYSQRSGAATGPVAASTDSAGHDVIDLTLDDEGDSYMSLSADDWDSMIGSQSIDGSYLSDSVAGQQSAVSQAESLDGSLLDWHQRGMQPESDIGAAFGDVADRFGRMMR